MVNLLVYKWVVCLPHLGLQFGLITAIFLTYREKVGLMKFTKVTEKTWWLPEAILAKAVSAPESHGATPSSPGAGRCWQWGRAAEPWR